jgi:hypothetical protein
MLNCDIYRRGMNPKAVQNLLHSAAIELTKALKNLQSVRHTFQDLILHGAAKELDKLWIHLFLEYEDSLAYNLELLTELDRLLSKTRLISAYPNFLIRIIYHRSPITVSDIEVLVRILDEPAENLQRQLEQIVRFVAQFDDDKTDAYSSLLLLFEGPIKKLSHATRGLSTLKDLLYEAELLLIDSGQRLPKQDWHFISDENLKLILARDYAELGKLLEISAHKSALVLCGSILEAALVAVLANEEARAQLSYANLYPNRHNPVPPIEEWRLFQLIGVAENIGKLDGDTRRQADILRDYRNLIHPVAEVRRATVLDEELVAAEVILLKRVLRLLSSP